MNSKSEILAAAAAEHPVITNPTATGMNVLTKEEYTNLAKFVFHQIVDVLSKSYGPYGSMTLINRSGYRFSTKDGWRILMYTVFNHNPYYEAIHRMIFEVCEQMNDTVGDGTTTVILMANRIYEQLINDMDNIEEMDLPPRDLFKSFDHVVYKVTEELKKSAERFSLEHVRPISMIATNNDEKITQCICDLYERNPEAEIQIMESNKIGVSIENVDGLKIPVTLVDRIYINSKTEKVCDVKDGLYLVFNHKIGEKAIKNIVLKMEQTAKALNKRLVVIAPAYDEHIMVGMWMKKTTDEFRTSGTTTTILCHYKTTVMGVAGAEDLAILLDTHPIDGRMVDALCDGSGLIAGQHDNNRIAIKNRSNTQEIVLGYCDNAKLGYDVHSFFSGLHPISMTLDAQKDLVKQEIQGLEDTMTVTEKATSMKLSQLKKRLARLEMKMSVIYYGADSTFDKEMIHDTIEDGVRALESAREFGIVRGSQYDLLDAVKEVYRTSINEIDKYILKSMIVGIQNMLKYDLYGKSKAIRDALNNQYDSAKSYSMRTARAQTFFECYQGLFSETEDCPVYPLDMITLQPDKNLITSTETDICALKASIELLKILIAGNQLLMVD